MVSSVLSPLTLSQEVGLFVTAPVDNLSQQRGLLAKWKPCVYPIAFSQWGFLVLRPVQPSPSFEDIRFPKPQRKSCTDAGDNDIEDRHRR
jgi:hypothetical protein